MRGWRVLRRCAHCLFEWICRRRRARSGAKLRNGLRRRFKLSAPARGLKLRRRRLRSCNRLLAWRQLMARAQRRCARTGTARNLVQLCRDLFHLPCECANLRLQRQHPDVDFARSATRTARCRRNASRGKPARSGCARTTPHKGLQGGDNALHIENALFEPGNPLAQIASWLGSNALLVFRSRLVLGFHLGHPDQAPANKRYDGSQN